MTINRLSAIVLAAGRSRRMGQSKPLLPLGGKTVLQQVLTALAAAGPARIFVVLGPASRAVAESLAGWPVSIVWNAAQESEMADSLRSGLAALPPEEHGVLVCLGDQPLIEHETFRRLAREHQRRPEAILQPQFGTRRGHPVLLPRSILQRITDFASLRELLAAHAERLHPIAVEDPGILQDLDTPADYRQALSTWQIRRP